MKHDLFLGILVGVVLGIVFTATLTPHLPLLVILAVLIFANVISIK